MIRLVAANPDTVLDELQATRIKFWLLEFLPTPKCQVNRGPNIEIVVDDRDPDDLVPVIRHKLEDIIGCSLANA
ncbi:hypothetical protein HH310_40305 [Actinoplanes sp. TBRC 11911]|uniref:hypothetical protein n=1 Tax=Actinoplanes sp. TBRC 11911 TaxID=2729386 RepID=UPI00145D718D|nr:hypothetical protein [Actinoplanes sp. TBRC 11911]NMO57402.1 hypothetical protein [Actinoplanes sp. TBRC 11911]